MQVFATVDCRYVPLPPAGTASTVSRRPAAFHEVTTIAKGGLLRCRSRLMTKQGRRQYALDSAEIRSNQRLIKVDWRGQAFGIMIELGYS